MPPKVTLRHLCALCQLRNSVLHHAHTSLTSDAAELQLRRSWLTRAGPRCRSCTKPFLTLLNCGLLKPFWTCTVVLEALDCPLRTSAPMWWATRQWVSKYDVHEACGLGVRRGSG